MPFNRKNLMRTDQEIKALIIDKALTDDRIRAVLLTGSRANKKILPDKLQDFDIVYIVTEIESFIRDHSWVNYFGERIIWQLPDEMTFQPEKKQPLKERASFTYLMLFKDRNRIDLTLVSKDKLKTDFRPDTLAIVWLDKDKIFSKNTPTDTDYLIKRPIEQEFKDTCNEFWWVSTYVIKGLLRNEITYAKQMGETIVRPMFMKMIEWYIGTNTNFSVSFGTGGRHMSEYLEKSLYDRILFTYSDYKIENNWKSLITMTEIFGELAARVSDRLDFNHNSGEEQNVKLYVGQCYEDFLMKNKG